MQEKERISVVDVCRECCVASLKRLDVDCIDLYYLHRVDSCVPIEQTMLELKVTCVNLHAWQSTPLVVAPSAHCASRLEQQFRFCLLPGH